MADHRITVFRSRFRPGMTNEDEEAYRRDAARMEELAAQNPGFVSVKTFQAEDGERVTIAEFADEASQDTWRRQEEHLGAQGRGRETYYQEYEVVVAEILRRYDWRESS